MRGYGRRYLCVCVCVCWCGCGCGCLCHRAVITMTRTLMRCRFRSVVRRRQQLTICAGRRASLKAATRTRTRTRTLTHTHSVAPAALCLTAPGCPHFLLILLAIFYNPFCWLPFSNVSTSCCCCLSFHCCCCCRCCCLWKFMKSDCVSRKYYAASGIGSPRPPAQRCCCESDSNKLFLFLGPSFVAAGKTFGFC